MDTPSPESPPNPSGNPAGDYELPAGSVEADFLAWRSTGDAAALERVFDAIAPDLLKLGLHLVGQAADAEDLVQQTFLAAVQNPDSWVAGRPLRPFLTTILRRRAIDAHRRRRPTEDIDAGLDWVAEQAAPDDEAMQAEMSAELAKALDKLREPYRQAMLLRLRHGMRSADIAHVLNLSPGAVRMRLSRGTELLRGLLPVALGAVLATLPFSGRGLAAVREGVLAAARSLPPGPPPGSGSARPLGSLRLPGGLQGGLGWIALSVPLVLGVLALVADGGRDRVERPDAAGPAGLGERGGVVSLEGALAASNSSSELRSGTAELPAAEVAPAASLTVRLRHAGAPREGVRLELIDPKRTAGVGRRIAHTDAAGEAFFAELADGCFRLDASNGLRRRVLLEPGERRVEELDCPFPLQVHVSVVDPDGLPIPGANIEARDRAHVWYPLGVADDAGMLSIELAERPPVVRAMAPGFRNDGGRGVPDLTRPDQPLVLQLEPGGARLTVLVRNEDASDIGAARLRFGRAQKPRPPRFGRNGLPVSLPKFASFEVRDLFDQQLVLEGLAPGQYWLLAEGAHSGVAAQVFELEEGEDRRTEFVLPPSAELVVRAYDFESMPIEGVRLAARSQLSGELVLGETGDSGEMRLKGLVPGIWTVHTEGQSESLGQARVSETSGATVDVLLDRAAVLTGDELGGLRVHPPLPGPDVDEFALPRFELYSPDGRHHSTHAFEGSVLELSGLPPGLYSGRVLAVGCAPVELEGLRVEAGELREAHAGAMGLGAYLWCSADRVAPLSVYREDRQVGSGRLRPHEPLLIGPLEPGTLRVEVGRGDDGYERMVVVHPGQRLELRL